MARFNIPATSNQPQQIVNAPPPGCGYCIIMQNQSATDQVYVSDDSAALAAAKQNATDDAGFAVENTNFSGGGSTIVLPWVTTALYAIDYNTSGDGAVLEVEVWQGGD